MTGFIYAIKAANQRVKIGWSNDPRRRYREVAVNCPEKTELIGFFPGTRADEAAAHERLRPWRITGEWFDFEAREVVAFVATLDRPICIDRSRPPFRSDIKKAREAAGESQAAFGERFGVDQSTVHRWETAGPPTRGSARKMVERVLADIGAAASEAEPAA